MATDKKSQALELWDLLVWAFRSAFRYLSRLLICTAKRIAIVVLHMAITIGVLVILSYVFYKGITATGIVTPNEIDAAVKACKDIRDKFMEHPNQYIEAIKLMGIWCVVSLLGLGPTILIFSSKSSETIKLEARIKALEDQKA